MHRQSHCNERRAKISCREDRHRLSDAAVTTKAGQALAIKALTPGVVKLTGVTTDGSKKTVSCTITVRGQVTGVWLNPKAPAVSGNNKGFNGVEEKSVGASPRVYTGQLKPGASLTLKPVVIIENVRSSETGKKYFNAFKSYTDTAVSYRSSDPFMAKVDKGGKISIPRTALAENEASKTVSVYAMSPDGEQIAEYEIKVKK